MLVGEEQGFVFVEEIAPDRMSYSSEVRPNLVLAASSWKNCQVSVFSHPAKHNAVRDAGEAIRARRHTQRDGARLIRPQG